VLMIICADGFLESNLRKLFLLWPLLWTGEGLKASTVEFKGGTLHQPCRDPRRAGDCGDPATLNLGRGSFKGGPPIPFASTILHIRRGHDFCGTWGPPNVTWKEVHWSTHYGDFNGCALLLSVCVSWRSQLLCRFLR